LLRGDYVKAVAEMEYRGVPIDVPCRDRLLAEWPRVQLDLIRCIDQDFDVYDGTTFVTAKFNHYLTKHRLAWPRTATGAPSLSKETFKEASQTYAQLAPLHELRATLTQMREWKLAVGSDGRARCLLGPFGTKTGRNATSCDEERGEMKSDGRFIFTLASHLRSLIKPPPGRAVAYLDFAQQEFGIAAYLSGDLRLIEAYRSGDAYLHFAKQVSAVPADATRESHEAIHALFKTCALGVQFGMGAESLAYRINDSFGQARELLRLHHEMYPRYWEWSRACIDYATAYGHLTASFGWRIHVTAKTKLTTLRNFLLQANGAEMIRWACVLCSQRGLPVCCPVHDALLIEDDTDRIDVTVEAVREAMVEASEKVLPGFPLRVEAKVYRYPDRFVDKRGVTMWETIWKLIDGQK
jgi:hypothetical protein